MAPTPFSPLLRRSLFAAPRFATRRPLSTSSRLLNTADAAAAGQALPAQKPVGAFRGGLFGFLFGSAAAGTAVYYYILEEYRVSNEMLTEDIYALQAATQRLNSYVMDLEGKLDQLQKKK